MEDYLILYGEKKPEDLICFLNMFPNAKKIELGWTIKQQEENTKKMVQEIEKGKKQIIFLGLEIGWDKLIETIKQTYPSVLIKVICTTLDSLLYYEYERKNFFRLLELNKAGKVDLIAFLRRGQFELYQTLGYSCFYLMENYQLTNDKKTILQNKKGEANQNICLGIYPLNYTWDKNIFNQLCIAKFVENSKVRYLNLHERMEEFLETMKIPSEKVKIKPDDDELLLEDLTKNSMNIDCSFTQYFHPIFFMSMELGIPCLIGNHCDFLQSQQELKNYLVTKAEDNPIINAEMIKIAISKNEEIQELYQKWKTEYNQKAQENKNEFFRIGRESKCKD